MRRQRAERGPTLWRLVGVVAAVALAMAPSVVLAHGVGKPAPDAWTVVTGWEFDPIFILSMAAVSWLYVTGVRRVNHAHPNSRFPRRRVAFFFSGVGVMVLAVMSPVAYYDTELFSIHMVQHLLIIMVAAPLILLGTPVTLALRAASPAVRKGVLLPLLKSGPVRAITFPVFTWLLLAGTMWATHFLPLYNAALENRWLHGFEHIWYLNAALLFWWPAVAIDPTPWRLNHPVRMLYVFLQMPQNSFLAVAIFGSGRVIYPHYEKLARSWGPSALRDQQIAGLIMWIGGDLLFLGALAFIAWGWVKHEEIEAKRQDRALDRRRRLAVD